MFKGKTFIEGKVLNHAVYFSESDCWQKIKIQQELAFRRSARSTIRFDFCDISSKIGK
jgi:hypothetical protein